MGRYHFVFPRWSNLLLPTILVGGALAPIYVIFIVAYGFSPRTTDVGYAPDQPVPFSHRVHAGQLGMDCRYCHNTVEHADHAAIPPTQTCMNCHTQIHATSSKLEPVRQSWMSGEPINWIRVHDLPDYSYFSHAAHVNRGVSCVDCHGRVDQMEVVYQHEMLSMNWCLDCHRSGYQVKVRDPHLVTDLGWTFQGTRQERLNYFDQLNEQLQLQPNDNCSTCHR